MALQVRLNGVEGLQALGAFFETTLSDARHAHAESRKLLAKGIHPVRARREARETRVRADLHRELKAWQTGGVHVRSFTPADRRTRLLRG
ncbi:MAG: integrase arm-type DNA-binding domain-containing protein [Immundisolibacter sp.]|uniref:integrase arm-type DNA-binding domain-containing protein n=1 Tax=Immundisolibacter sp. TaxID=1934948 RepID=UPI003EE34FC0